MSTTLGRLIRARRVQLGLTQRDIATAAGVTDSAISLVESGITKEMQPETLEKVAQALGLSTQDLLHPGEPLRDALRETATGLAEALRGVRSESLIKAQRETGGALLDAIVRGTLTAEDLTMIRTMIDSLVTKNSALDHNR